MGHEGPDHCMPPNFLCDGHCVKLLHCKPVKSAELNASRCSACEGALHMSSVGKLYNRLKNECDDFFGHKV